MRCEKIGNQTLYYGDCFELMGQMQNESVDLVLTDPPYGDNFCYGRHSKSILNNESVDINFKCMQSVVSKLKKDRSFYIFSNYKYEIDLRSFQRDNIPDLKFLHLICVVKNNMGMGYPFRNQAEYICVFEKGKCEFYSKNFSDVQRCGFILSDAFTHPHQKSTELLNRILMHSCKKNEIVFDPFMGSGSTLVSCQQTGRYGIGCELELKWFDLACKRVEQECKKRRLF